MDLCKLFGTLLLIILNINLVSSELLLVVEVFRHGGRVPLETKFSTAFGAKWNIMSEDLTNSGERQHYLLGLKRRKNYIDELEFLPSKYDPRIMYIESTDLNRTIMSAQAHLMGMYPPEFDKEHKASEREKKATLPFANYVVPENIPFGYNNEDRFPAGIRVRNFRSDLMRAYEGYVCPRQIMIQQRNFRMSNHEFENIDYVKKMINEVNKNCILEEPISMFSEMWSYADAYYSLLFHNKRKSVVMSQYFESHMMDVFKLGLFETMYRDDLGLRLTSHNFFTLLSIVISEKMGGSTEVVDTIATSSIPKDRKYYMLSGHDTSLVAYLCGIERRDVPVPEYASR